MKTSSSRRAGKRPKLGIALPWAWNQGGKIRGHRIQTCANTSRLRPLGGTRCVNAVGVWRCIRGAGGRVGWRATLGASSHPSGGCPRPAVILPGRSPRAVRTPPGGSSGDRHGGWVLLPLPSPPATLRPRRSQRAQSDRRGRGRARPPSAPLPERGTAPSSTPRAPRWSLKDQALRSCVRPRCPTTAARVPRAHIARARSWEGAGSPATGAAGWRGRVNRGGAAWRRVPSLRPGACPRGPAPAPPRSACRDRRRRVRPRTGTAVTVAVSDLAQPVPPPPPCPGGAVAWPPGQPGGSGTRARRVGSGEARPPRA